MFSSSSPLVSSSLLSSSILIQSSDVLPTTKSSSLPLASSLTSSLPLTSSLTSSQQKVYKNYININVKMIIIINTL
jgi:hypothetical protein